MNDIRIILALLISINIVIILLTVKRSCIHEGKIEVNHILTFSLGYFYYLLIPIIVGINQLFNNRPAMELWFSIFNLIKADTFIIYIIFITTWYLIFIFGSELANRVGNFKIRNFYFDKKALNIFWVLFLLLSSFFIYKFRNNFFQGYTNVGNLDFSDRGPFIALSLVIFSLAIIYATKFEMDAVEKLNFKRVVLNKFSFIFLFVSILVLSLGGRLYFASAIMGILVYYTVYFKSIKIWKFIVDISMFVLIMGIIGVLRAGNIDNILDKALFNLLQEPLYTSFSLIGFLEAGSFDVIKFPKFLLSEFINLIPTFMLPNKLDYILKPIDYGYIIINPLGATNAFVSFMVNFGYLGSTIVFFFAGFFIQKIKIRETSIISKSIYIILSGFLTFTLFRDGFVTSIVKNIFQFSILTPILIVISTHLISVAVRRRNIIIPRNETRKQK